MLHVVPKRLAAVTLVSAIACRGILPAPAQTTQVSYVVSTLAGIATSRGHSDGPALSAQFNGPTSVAIAPDGAAYVADPGNNTIRKITPIGVMTVAGTAGVKGNIDGIGASARFNNPSGVAVDSAGNVYVADSGNDTIREITPDGSVTTLAGRSGISGSVDGDVSTATFSFPTSLVMGRQGELFVADTHNSTIRVVANGTVRTIAGRAGVNGNNDGTGTGATFNQPVGLALEGTGDLVVADSGNNEIRRVRLDGVVQTIAGSAAAGSADGDSATARFNNPNSVVALPDGTIFVADSGNNCIRKIDPSGRVTTYAGASNAFGFFQDDDGATAKFSFPAGIAVDNTGSLLVADYFNNAVRQITPARAVTTIAGTPDPSTHADGRGPLAHFTNPAGVATDGRGAAYVADFGDNTIRKVLPDGTVSTLAGHSGVSGSADGIGTSATFDRPWGIAVNSHGDVFVADSGNHTIRHISADGIVVTLAGVAGKFGAVDGTGGAARFNSPRGIALDSTGALYVADSTSGTIRKVTPDGIVSTFAGAAGNPGIADGMGLKAQFRLPTGLALDSTGNVFVADAGNDAIRKIARDGMVSTVAGVGPPPGSYGDAPPNSGSADGPVNSARFYYPAALAIDAMNNIFVADAYNHTIRRISTGGQVVTLAGFPGEAGFGDGAGANANFRAPLGIALTEDHSLWIADTGNHEIRVAKPLPEFVAFSSHATITRGRTTVLSAIATNSPGSFQWYLEGLPIPGATAPSLILSGEMLVDGGSYTCTATNANGTTDSSAVVLGFADDMVPPGRIENVSGLGVVEPSTAPLIGGVVLRGASSASLLVRGVGPGLAKFLPGAPVMLSATLEVDDAGGAELARATGWTSVAPLVRDFEAVGAFPFGPESGDAAIEVQLASMERTITANLNNIGRVPGAGLLEFYNLRAGPTDATIVNASIRGLVTKTSSSIMGLAISGGTPETVLIRCVGPSLQGFGISDALESLAAAVYDSKGALVATSKQWGDPPKDVSLASVVGVAQAQTKVFRAVGAFDFEQGSGDAAFVLTLNPGTYTIIVGSPSGSGISLTEVYEIP